MYMYDLPFPSRSKSEIIEMLILDKETNDQSSLLIPPFFCDFEVKTSTVIIIRRQT